MSYGGHQRNSLSACHAKFLTVHTYFNPDIPIAKSPPPTIELISPHASDRETSFSIQLKVRDPDGIHQVLLNKSGNITRVACRGLTGEKDAVVEFNYYDIIPPDGVTSLSNPAAHRILVNAFDIGGNGNKAYFVLDLGGRVPFLKCWRKSPVKSSGESPEAHWPIPWSWK